MPAPLVCVLNRTGRARLLACAACGSLARCEVCGRPVGADPAAPGALACRGCGTTRPAVCAACGATRLKVLRQGVSRAREELSALLGVAVAEVAGPAAPGGPAVPDAPVLVGTEAVLHRVRRAGAVAFLDFDQHLLAPRLGAAEEALALLARAGRLVGGRTPAGPGRPAPVLVQTRLPDHSVITAAVHGDPGPLAQDELALRRQLGLPPASALAVLTGATAPAYAVALSAGAAGGAGSPVAVAALGGERFEVRAPDHPTLCDALAATPRPVGALRVAVDPLDI